MWYIAIMIRRVNAEHLKQTIETQAVEWKNSLSEKAEAMEALDAMVNSDIAKGLVIFGVSPDGTARGVDPGDLDKAQRSLTQHIRYKFDPPLIHTIELVECEGKIMIGVRAERNRDIPYHEYNGRAWIREGSSKRQLSVQEKKQLTRRRDRDQRTGPWKCDRCGSLVGQLYSFVFTDQGMYKTHKCTCGGEYWPVN